MQEQKNSSEQKSKKTVSENIRKFIKWKENKKIVLMYIFVPIIVNLIIEMFGRKSVVKGFVHMFTNPLTFLANVMIIVLTMSFTLLMKKRIFGIAIVSAVWLLFGIVNFVLLSNRVTPFGAPDFKNIAEALKVMNKYMNLLTYILIIALVAALLLGIMYIWFKVPKIQTKINYFKNTALIIVIALLSAGALKVGLMTGSLSTKLPELSVAYQKYGFVYCFSNSVVNTGVAKPDDYSPDKIDDIVKDPEETGKTEPETLAPTPAATKDAEKTLPEPTKKPNIIIVQLESFFDITEVKSLKFSEDPIPNFHKFMKNWPGGHLSMPCVGAGTANSEFEMLTSMNLDYFGPGEYPYKTILKTTTCESISYNLKEYGYATHALHNNTGGFYGRNTVFSKLGFDDFTSVEYMNGVEQTPQGWAKDSILTDQINMILNSTKQQDFIFAISVQGHGSYPTNAEIDTKVKITSGTEEESRLKAMEYYTQQIHEMDQFVANLIKAMKKRKNEDTIVVFYGDHLPSFGLADNDVTTGSIYNTPYFIWNNCGLKYESEDIQAYQMQPKLLKELRMEAGVVNKYHQENKDIEEYQNGLQNLEYDLLYGKQLAYNGVNPYKPTELKMGVNEIKITNIIKEADGYVTVKGENFTPYSKVFVNDDYFQDTEFVDPQTLRIQYPKLTALDSFVVSQAHSATNILSSSKESLYYGD